MCTEQLIYSPCRWTISDHLDKTTKRLTDNWKSSLQAK